MERRNSLIFPWLQRFAFVVFPLLLIITWLQPWYSIHFDWERVRTGNLYPVIWQNYRVDDEQFNHIGLFDEPVRMYPTTQQRKAKLLNLIKGLETTGYQVRDNPVVHLDKPILWGENRQNDANWHFKLNAWDMLVPYFQLYELTEDEKWLKTPSRIIHDWVNLNLIGEHSNTFKWHDMATGLRAIQLAVFIQSKEFNGLPLTKRNLILYAAETHVRVLKQKGLLSEGNHGLFQLVGLASLCKAASFQGCRQGREFATFHFSRLVNQQFTKEGIHKEHSSQYHVWAIKVLERIQKLDLFDVNDFKRLALARDNAKWFYHPDNNLSLFGDSERKPVSQAKYISSELAFLTNNKVGHEPSEYFSIFAESGFAFYRYPWANSEKLRTSYLAISAAFHSRVHKQRDDFTFEWFEKGVRLISDSGKYSYDNNDISQFFRMRKAHNTVTIDDEKKWFSAPKPYGSAIVDGGFSNGIFWVEMSMERVEYETHHRRHILLSPGKWLLVFDSLNSDESHKYTQWFHFEPGLELLTVQGKTIFELPDSDALLSVAHWPDNDDSRAEYFGIKGENMNGWISDTYRKKQARLSVSYSHTNTNVVVATLFGLGQVEDFEIVAIKEQFLACWRLDEEEVAVLFPATPLPEPSSCF